MEEWISVVYLYFLTLSKYSFKNAFIQHCFLKHIDRSYIILPCLLGHCSVSFIQLIVHLDKEEICPGNFPHWKSDIQFVYMKYFLQYFVGYRVVHI